MQRRVFADIADADEGDIGPGAQVENVMHRLLVVHDGLFLVETVCGGDGQRIDAAQRPVIAVADQCLDGARDVRVGGFA